MVKKNIINLSTEEKILESAKSEFLEKGYGGTRMQNIAKKAGINKALLHYYFRSKENLFYSIFNKAFADFVPQIMSIFNSEKPLQQKLKILIDNYISLLSRNRHIPIFILSEMQHNKNLLPEILKMNGANPKMLIKLITKDLKNNNIHNISPTHLLVNIFSMCIFPFAALPVLKVMLFDNNDNKYNKFLNERKKEVYNFVISNLSNN